jgi:cytochrome bd-type quinol oxidase subunit 2
MISGAVITAAGMSWPAFPNPPSPTVGLLQNLGAGILVAVCLALLARGLRGSNAVRWLVLTAFIYVTFALANEIEAAAFTKFGGTATMILFFIAPCVLAAGAASRLIQPADPQPLETAFAGRPPSAWGWRLIVVWLAFPVIYIFFGMLAAPIVVPYYQDPSFGLTLPGWGTIMPVVLLRSALVLAVTLPVVALWSRSRRSLRVTLSVALFAFMGLIGLAMTTFFPPTLRIAHSLEILGDSVVYAWVLVALFVPRLKAMRTQPAPAGAR